MTPNKSLDERTADFLSSVSQRVSRRALMNRVGTWALRITGLSVVGVVLPVDRAFAQFGCSGDWQTCNMHGFWCKSCCGHGARYNQCPSCTAMGAFWTGCCSSDGGCTSALIRYFDCCAPAGYAEDCQGDSCGMFGSCPSNWPAYCTGGLEFRCTIVVNTGNPCSPVEGHC